MIDDIDTFIRALVRDITAVDTDTKTLTSMVAVHTEPDRRLLALLIAYQLGEDLANKVLGDENNA